MSEPCKEAWDAAREIHHAFRLPILSTHWLQKRGEAARLIQQAMEERDARHRESYSDSPVTFDYTHAED